MGIIFLNINPKLNKMNSGFSSDNQPGDLTQAEFFELRARRRRLCEICFVFAILVLVFSTSWDLELKMVLTTNYSLII